MELSLDNLKYISYNIVNCDNSPRILFGFNEKNANQKHDRIRAKTDGATPARSFYKGRVGVVQQFNPRPGVFLFLQAD